MLLFVINHPYLTAIMSYPEIPFFSIGFNKSALVISNADSEVLQLIRDTVDNQLSVQLEQDFSKHDYFIIKFKQNVFCPYMEPQYHDIHVLLCALLTKLHGKGYNLVFGGRINKFVRRGLWCFEKSSEKAKMLRHTTTYCAIDFIRSDRIRFVNLDEMAVKELVDVVHQRWSKIQSSKAENNTCHQVKISGVPWFNCHNEETVKIRELVIALMQKMRDMGWEQCASTVLDEVHDTTYFRSVQRSAGSSHAESRFVGLSLDETNFFRFVSVPQYYQDIMRPVIENQYRVVKESYGINVDLHPSRYVANVQAVRVITLLLTELWNQGLEIIVKVNPFKKNEDRGILCFQTRNGLQYEESHFCAVDLKYEGEIRGLYLSEDAVIALTDALKSQVTLSKFQNPAPGDFRWMVMINPCTGEKSDLGRLAWSLHLLNLIVHTLKKQGYMLQCSIDTSGFFYRGENDKNQKNNTDCLFFRKFGPYPETKQGSGRNF